MSMQQSNNITNEYQKFLAYLEDQETTYLSTKKEVEVLKVKKIKEDTQKLLDECKVEQVKKSKPKKQKRKVSPDKTGFSVDKFENLMRSKLVDGHKRMQSYDRPYISVTELVSCIRKAYYQRQKYPIDINQQYRFAYLSLINHVGDAVHEFIQELYDFEETEKTLISEVYKVKGRIDGLRGKFLIEFKTIDEEKFKGEYIDFHYKQGLIYAYILNEEYNYNVDTITIVYIIRNLKKIVPFDLPYDHDLAKSIIDKAHLLKQSLTAQKPPDPYNAKKEECSFCQYISYCMKDESQIKLPYAVNKQDKLESNGMNNSIFLL